MQTDPLRKAIWDELEAFKNRLRVRVSVDVGPQAYSTPSVDRVLVKVELLLDDEVISEDESYSTLPDKS